MKKSVSNAVAVAIGLLALLVVNFWATWCAPCIEEMPDLAKVQREYADRGVAVIGLAIDNAGAVKRFRDELKLQLPLLVAGAE